MNKTRILLLFLSIISVIKLVGQNDFPGVNYTAVYRDGSGQVIPNMDLTVRIDINSENGNLLIWQEVQSVTTDGFGYFQTIIGQGISTGNGLVTDFSSINWGVAVYTIGVLIDDGAGFVDFGENNLYSVPYALYAKTAENQLYLNKLADVDTVGISEDDILKWDGQHWVVSAMNDTVAYAELAINSFQSIYADTATYALNLINNPIVDTADFAFYGDTANYSLDAFSATFADTAGYADSAEYALNADGVWRANGNDLNGQSAILGSLDSNDVVFVTNQQERMRIKADGKIGFGTQTPVSDFHIVNNDGLIAEGQLGVGNFPIEGAGIRMMWVPKKAAFRVGEVTGGNWNDFRTGNYSFAGGFNTRSEGDYSFAFGQSSWTTGDNSVAMGFVSQASGNGAIAMGSVAAATGVSSISLGRATLATDSASFAIGYHTEAHGKAGGAFGYQSISNADYSIVFGYRAKANHSGCFVFSDASTLFNSQAFTTTTAANQFLVKASGGTYFYSDKDQLSGVYLAPGSGSWSSLSDKNSKENIEKIDYLSILDRVENLNIYTWNYITQDNSIRHIGPFAQDIYAAFGFGETDKAISIVDMDGINLASIKALIIKIEKLKEKINDNNAYKEKYLALVKTFETLKARVNALELK